MHVAFVTVSFYAEVRTQLFFLQNPVSSAVYRLSLTLYLAFGSQCLPMVCCFLDGLAYVGRSIQLQQRMNPCSTWTALPCYVCFSVSPGSGWPTYSYLVLRQSDSSQSISVSVIVLKHFSVSVFVLKHISVSVTVLKHQGKCKSIFTSGIHILRINLNLILLQCFTV